MYGLCSDFISLFELHPPIIINKDDKSNLLIIFVFEFILKVQRKVNLTIIRRTKRRDIIIVILTEIYITNWQYSVRNSTFRWIKTNIETYH